MALISHTNGQNDSPNPQAGRGFSAGLLGRLSQRRHFGFISYIKPTDLYVLAFMIGVASYFSLPHEPGRFVFWALFMGIALCALLRYRFRSSNAPLKAALLSALIFTSLGFLISQSRTQSAKIDFLPDYARGHQISGWVEGQDRGRTGQRYMIRLHELDGKSVTIKRLRVRGPKEGVEIGAFVQVKAVLSGPPFAATPGGYNARRAAYFKGLGGSGYAVTPFQSAPPMTLSAREGLERKIIMLRYNLAQRIKRQSPPKAAGLQAALMTGLRNDIEPDQVDALRASGLAHILAISGLHMALLAGSFYSLISLILASIPRLARGRDVRKFAALAGICVATLYLVVSGASVATQRAYIMAVILFLAVILDRQALSTRSVSLAALITLLIHPESLLSVGFQMSFAAVLALVVVYRHWADWQAMRGWVMTRGIWARLRNGFVSLSVTSLVAGLATGLFAVMHFQRWAKYGLMGNLAAMPVFTFLVMPMALLTFLALPFGLERYPLWVMGQGLEQVLWTANHIHNLPESMLAFNRPPAGFIALYAACFILICLGRIGLKFIAATLALIFAVIWFKAPLAVMRISEDGRVTWQSDEGTYFTVNPRADKFGRTQFLRGNGAPDAPVSPASRLDNCDAQGCLLSLRGQQVAIIETPDLLPEACEMSALVILKKRRAGPRAQYLCKAEIIDPQDFEAVGAIDLYIDGNGWQRRSVKQRGGQTTYTRPWD